MKLFKVSIATYNIFANFVIVALLWIGFFGGLTLFFVWLGEDTGSNVLAAFLIVRAMQHLFDLSKEVFAS